MTIMTNRYYETINDYLHPNVHTFVYHYRNGDLICHSITAVIESIGMELEN